MVLRLDDKWVWDSWYVKDGNDFHVFYLQANRSLNDPDLRHWNASIGHSVSSDLRNWRRLPDALVPGVGEGITPDGGNLPADSMATWTGSILRVKDQWWMFYTGVSHDEEGAKQRICLAVSDDLISWRRREIRGVVQADRQWYEKREDGPKILEAWRDPFVVRDPKTHLYHMYITARLNHGPYDERGVVACATSKNLLDWKIHGPVCEGGRFAEMEVPQIITHGGAYHMMFCVMGYSVAESYAKILPNGAVGGMHCFTSDTLQGPFEPIEEDFWFADKTGSLFAGRCVEISPGEKVLMAFKNIDAHGNFVGEIADPLPIAFDRKGKLGIELRTMSI